MKEGRLVMPDSVARRKNLGFSRAPHILGMRMNHDPDSNEKKPRPILLGVLIGAFVALVITGWMVLSPSALLHRQLAAASSSPAAPAPPPVERPVRGRVLDADTGAPLRGASVWAGTEELRTDEEGRFTTPPIGLGAAFLVRPELRASPARR